MNANIDTLNNELEVKTFTVVGKTQKDISYSAHFRLPDGTEKTKDFKVHATQTCVLADIVAPTYELTKSFDISSKGAFEYQIPDLTVPAGC